MRIGTRGKHTGPRLRGPTWLLALVSVLSVAPFAGSADPATGKLVVVLYPENNNGSPGSVLADQGLRSIFATGSAEPIEIYSEYLDISRLRAAGDLSLQTDYLRQKYAGRKVDLVIAGLSSALDFALEHRADIFPGAPIVLLAVDEGEVNARRLPPDVVGAPVKMDLAATLGLALQLHPNTQRVYVVAGKSKMDDAWVAQARRESKRYENQVEFTY